MNKWTLLLLLTLITACARTEIDQEPTDYRAKPRVTTLAERERSDPPVPVDTGSAEGKLVADTTETILSGGDGRFEQIGTEQAATVRPVRSTLLLLNDTRRRYDNDDHLNLHLVLAHDPATDTFLEIGFWTLYYGDPSEEFPAYQNYQRRVLSVSEHFGEWNGYFYTADHNGNGIEELIGFQLAGCCFVPEVWEYSEGAFHQVLDVSNLSDNTLAIEVPGPGEVILYGPNYVTGSYLRFAFDWNPESGLYELTEQREVETYPDTP